MSQYPGGQQPPPPQDPYYGQPPADPYGAPPPQDPYYGTPPPGDPYAPPADPYYGGQPQAGGQPQGQPGYYGPPPADPNAPPSEAEEGRGGSGAAIFGIILVIVGVWVLFGDQLELDLEFSEIWPVLAVLVGAALVVASLVPGRGRRQG
jgi:hypothetical protein